MPLSPKMRGEGLNVGDIVTLDNSGDVKIVYKTQAGIYCMVVDVDSPNS